MPVIRITKEFSFEAAHALTNYDGPCKNVHGHSYMLSVTIKGEPVDDLKSPKNGMVMDFGDLKKLIKKNIIDRFDHSLLLNSSDPAAGMKYPGETFSNILLVDYQPTSENMLKDFAETIRKILPEGIALHHLLLRETGNSYAEWYADDNK